MDIQFNIGIPIYKQLASIIREQINQGVYKPGYQIPPEDALCQKYDISRVTVRKAISLLTDDGLLVKQQGKGTFVTMSNIVESSRARGSFTLSCQQSGVVPSTKVEFCKIMETPHNIATDITEDKVICIKRVRCANELSVIFEIDYIPAKLHSYLLETNLENCSLLDTISGNSNLTSSGFEDIIDIRYAGEEESQHLNCKKGMPLLHVYQKVFCDDNNILYINDQFICSEHYKYKSVHKK